MTEQKQSNGRTVKKYYLSLMNFVTRNTPS